MTHKVHVPLLAYADLCHALPPPGHQHLHTRAILVKPSRAVWVYSKSVTASRSSSVIYIFVSSFVYT